MWEKATAALAACVLFAVVGTIIWSETSVQEHTVLIELKGHQDPFVALPQIMPSNQITDIKVINREKNEYEIRVRTREKPKTLLKWLTDNWRVEKAEIIDLDESPKASSNAP